MQKCDGQMEGISEHVNEYAQVVVRHQVEGVLMPVLRGWALVRIHELGCC